MNHTMSNYRELAEEALFHEGILRYFGERGANALTDGECTMEEMTDWLATAMAVEQVEIPEDEGWFCTPDVVTTAKATMLGIIGG